MICHSAAVFIEEVLFYSQITFFHLKFTCNKCPHLKNPTPPGHLLNKTV